MGYTTYVMMIKRIPNKLHRVLAKVAYACLALGLMTACINEDLSDCGREYGVEYELDLHTNLTTEISTNLTTEMEQKLGKELMKKMASVFRKYAHDVDLFFFTSDSLCAYRETNIIEDTAAVYTIHLPVRDYMHLSSANTLIEPTVVCKGEDYSPNYRIMIKGGDTLKCQNVGLFSARLPMEVRNVDQVFNVSLYMLNAASVLVLNQDSQDIKVIKGFVRGLADGFFVRDSVFSYRENRVLEQHSIQMDESELFALYGVGFPSRNLTQLSSRKAISKEVDDASYGSLWEYEVYVTMETGKVTKSVLYVKTPLKAGMLKILKARVAADGSLIPYDPEVGVNVTFDWKEGGSFEGDLG